MNKITFCLVITLLVTFTAICTDQLPTTPQLPNNQPNAQPLHKGPEQYLKAYQEAIAAAQMLYEAKQHFAATFKKIRTYEINKFGKIPLDQAKELSQSLLESKHFLVSRIDQATQLVNNFALLSAEEYTKQTGQPVPLLKGPSIYVVSYKPSLQPAPASIALNLERATYVLLDVTVRLFMPLEHYGLFGYKPLCEINAKIYEHIIGFDNAHATKETADDIRFLNKSAINIRYLCDCFAQAITDFQTTTAAAVAAEVESKTIK